MRSFATAALCLALLETTDARVPHSFREPIQRDAQPEPQPQGGIFEWFTRLLKRDLKPRQDATCYEDDYYVFVGSPSLGEGFCQDYMNYPNRTVPVEATATSTLTTTYTTAVDTITQYTRVTPSSTVTETVTGGGAKVKRDDNAKVTARAVLNRNEAFQLYRRQTNNTDNDNVMAQAFSSACSCHDYDGPVVSETYTGRTTVRTLRAFNNVDTTVMQTQTAPPDIATTTTTVGAPPPPPTTEAPSETSPIASEGPSNTDSNPSNPTPTAPAFTCPEDHNTTVSQMVGSERFDYLVLCDTILVEADIYRGVLSYRSFSECVGACSIADQQFDNPVCQGVSFQAMDNSGAGTCFLKGSANHTVLAEGVDSALLQRIAVGIANDTAQGTATESLPFGGVQPTADPSEIDSMMSSIVANSTRSMPMITPIQPPVQSGRQVGAITAYSTYVSDGSTFSSGTGYTLATTFANGSWYSAYYTSYTMTWASATTVYGASETGLAVENSTNSNSYQTNGVNGQYGIVTWSNTTYGNGSTQNVVQTVSYEANGDQFFSTATTYYTAATGAAGGGAGGAGGSTPVSIPAGPLVTASVIPSNGSESGGNAGGAAGGPGSGGPSLVTSTSIFPTQTVISQPGGTGAVISGYASGGPPVTFTGVSTIITNGSTAYETYYIISGTPTSTGGGSSGQVAGGPGTAPTLTPITVISTTGQTGGQSGALASGGPGNTGGASSVVLSGGPSSLPPPSGPSVPASLSLVTIISNSGATGGATSGGVGGGPGATGGASSGVLSGGPFSSPSNTTSPQTASFTGDNRSPGAEESSSTPAPILTAPSGGVYSPPGTAPGTAPSTTPTTNGTVPPGTSPLTASFTGDNRSPGAEESSSTPAPIYTAPSGGVYSPPGGVAPSGSPSGSYTGTGASRFGDYSTYPPNSAPGTAPPGTAPPGTATPGTAPSGTAPAGMSPGTYSAPNDSRNGDYSTSAAGTAPIGTGPSGYTLPPPLPSGPSQFPVPSGSQPIGTGPAPSGSAPAGTAPGTSPGTAPSSGLPAPTGSAPSSGIPIPTVTAPQSPGIPISTGTSPASFTNSNDSRFPGTGSSTIHTYPSMTFPAAQSSCANGTMATTTLFSTTTVYGCYSTCLPSWGGWGGYGGPQPFGPPAGATPAPEETGR